MERSDGNNLCLLTQIKSANSKNGITIILVFINLLQFYFKYFYTSFVDSNSDELSSIISGSVEKRLSFLRNDLLTSSEKIEIKRSDGLQHNLIKVCRAATDIYGIQGSSQLISPSGDSSSKARSISASRLKANADSPFKNSKKEAKSIRIVHMVTALLLFIYVSIFAYYSMLYNNFHVSI